MQDGQPGTLHQFGEKGFGWISPEDGSSSGYVFFHVQAVLNGNELDLVPGVKLKYEMGMDRPSGRMKAVKVLLDTPGAGNVQPATPEEVKRHNVSHLPFRSWCRHCGVGRGKNAAHAQLEAEKLHTYLAIGHDYGFLGKDDARAAMPMLVSKSSRSTLRPSAPQMLSMRVMGLCSASFCFSSCTRTGRTWIS